jgi:hypothetical protein
MERWYKFPMSMLPIKRPYRTQLISILIYTAWQASLFDCSDPNLNFSSLQACSPACSLFRSGNQQWVAALKSFWKTGLKNSKQIIGIDADELQSKWLAFISKPEFRFSINWDKIHTSGCE